MNIRFAITIVVSFLILSCKKNEQSCDDGVFTPEKEEKVDCGGVCPPCNVPSNIDPSYVSVDVNSISTSFGDYGINKTTDWILQFQNDSIFVFLNFGDGDSLGNRSIKVPNSKAVFNNVNYSTLTVGNVLFSEINHADNQLSGYFEAQFVSDIVSTDTLKLTGGQFEKVGW